MKKDKANTSSIVMIQTFRKNIDKFTGKDIDKAKLSRKMQSMVANPTYDRFKEIGSG